MEFIIEYIVHLFESTAENSIWLFFDPGHFFSFIHLSIAFGLAYILIRSRSTYKNQNYSPLKTILRTIKILFPRKIFLHRSSLHDYAILLINAAILTVVTFGGLWSTNLVMTYSNTILNSFDVTPLTTYHNAGITFVSSIYFMLIWDFAASFAHFLKHKWSFIWEFHKVHHSAKVLNPITAVRRHPVDVLFGSFIIILFVGLGYSIWVKFVNPNATYFVIFGGMAGIFIWRVLIYNLRHTHIWISYGPFWERILISPAQHQVHHSNDSRHYDKNFGHIFSFWDMIFGTLYITNKDERVDFGIEDEEMADYQTLTNLYLMPFIKLGRKFTSTLGVNSRQKS